MKDKFILDACCSVRMMWDKKNKRNKNTIDIFSNCNEWIKISKKCKNGMSCHERQPRGYQAKKKLGVLKLGTQGQKNAVERAIVPRQLCLEIIKVCEKLK